MKTAKTTVTILSALASVVLLASCAMVWMISVHKSCQPSVLRRDNRLKSLATGSFLVIVRDKS